MADTDERLRIVETDVATAHERMNAHETFCHAIHDQHTKDFKQHRVDHSELKAAVQWTNRWLIASLFTIIVSALCMYFGAK